MYDSLFLLDGLTEKERERCRQMAQTYEKHYCKGEPIYTKHMAQKALALVLPTLTTHTQLPVLLCATPLRKSMTQLS